MSYDDDMGHDADVDSGFESGASEPDYDGFYNPYESTSAKPTPGSKALLEEVKRRAAAPPDYQIGGADVDPQEWSKGYEALRGIAPELRDFEAGNTIFNPQATFFDWITAPVELAVGVGSRALTGGLLGVDLQLGRDVTGIKGHTDISQYGAGMRGPQAPGVQVDVGIPGVSSVLGPIAPDIGTISFDQTGLGFHSTFDPSQGAFGKAAMNVAKDAIKGASSYYAGGGLASLPQLSHSGLYRALGRG